GVNLAGETAVVVGGTRNIGLAVTRMLRGAGANVCAVGGSDTEALTNTLSELDADDGKTTGIVADIRDEAAVTKAFEHAERELGPVSILVNGPGFRPHGPFMDITLETWNAVLDVMLTGPFLTCRELFRRLPVDRKGAIVNIGGLSAHRPAKDRAHVIAAKAGIVGLTRALAAEGQGQIRANCIVPGLIETQRKAGQPQAHFKGDDLAHGSCDDVARLVLAFSSPGDSYVTGQTVHASGGRYMT
ncbi:MAG TPA: SDR family NAD(P)-dependent oxidoreductase, partial [Gammaproteobacteria bacterium]|nr:SDR family NAD(P)-dependent oxidoreductase [Gammaproteobacteria bacterium]